MKAYPQRYESWWLERASKQSPGTAEVHLLQKLEPVVSRLSDEFTIYRDDGAPENYDRPEDIIAYGLFFFPQTYTRTLWVVDELLERLQWMPKLERPLRVLDLGCGSGAASFALLDQLDQAGLKIEIEHYGVDRSGYNLDAARDLGESCSYKNIRVISKWLRRDITSNQFSWDQKPFNRPWDIILMSFSFGEFVVGLEDEQAVAVVQELSDVLAVKGTVIITEPSLMETSVRLEVVRDAVATSGELQVLAPCLHQEPCPALEQKRFWCHEVRKWHPPESIAFLNTRLHREIRFVKFSFVIFQKADSHFARDASSAYFRLVSPVSKKSGQMVCKGCSAEGAVNTYEWLTRGLSKEDVRNHLGLERGDCVFAKQVKPLGTAGRFRVEQM
ncbi:MAG: small ribosomal subunit Rsm22 family protein [Verrucomicrobiota bacterium]